jgi:hypothetical protein
MWRFCKWPLTREQFLEAPLLIGDTGGKYGFISCLENLMRNLMQYVKDSKIWEEPNPLGMLQVLFIQSG